MKKENKKSNNKKSSNKKPNEELYNKVLGVIIITFIALLILGMACILLDKRILITKHNNIYKVNAYDYAEVEELRNGYIFREYEDLKEYFYAPEITKKDFENHDFALAEIIYDPCSEKNIEIKSLDIKDDKITINITYDKYCDTCDARKYYYLVKIDKNTSYVYIEPIYKKTVKEKCNNLGYNEVEKKPIIYLYPEETTNVEVKLLNKDIITCSYPKYEDSWNVTAYSDGKLVDNKTNRKLYGLYWEGTNHEGKVQEDGFVVKGTDTVKFLEEKLELLGLNEYESEEFIIYWLPKLEKNNYNYIRFETDEEINNYMPIEVNPTPDTTIRIVMDYKPLEKEIKVNEQLLTKKERKGFTYVEWGGVEIN